MRAFRPRMNVLRFADLVTAGQLAGRRVFIRADLNVPQDDSGRITEDTRIRASLPAIETALAAGAAVMVTSHLGRPKEGEPRPEDSLAPVAARLGELLGRSVPLVSELGRRRRGARRRDRHARELPPQPRREEERSGAGAQDGGALRRLRQRRLRHRASRRGHDLRHRRVRAGRLRRAAARGRDRRDHEGARRAEAAAGGDRRRQQGLDQAAGPAEPGRQGRPADRRRRHRQHLPARRRACRSARAWPSRRWSTRRAP